MAKLPEINPLPRHRDLEEARVVKYAFNLGIKVRMMPWEDFPDHCGHSAPSHKGYITSPTEILWEPRQEMGSLGLMHDVHHALQWKLIKRDPMTQDEGGAHLWLDYIVCKMLRLKGWSKWMADYFLEEGDWGATSTKRRHEILVECKAYAKTLGWDRLVYGALGDRTFPYPNFKKTA